jgi:hypothetical protein
MLKRFVAVVAVLIGMPVAAGGQEDGANFALKMWAAFMCATYAENADAELSASEAAQKRFFTLGYDTGRLFLEGINDGTISAAEVNRAPVYVVLLLQGPSIDFILGRMFEFASQNAYEKISKSGDTAIVAATQYRQSNCALIR